MSDESDADADATDPEASADVGDATDATPAPVPAPVRSFVAGVRSAEIDEAYVWTADDVRVPVPSRFDRPSPTAEWRFDGRLTVRIRSLPTTDGETESDDG